MHTKDSGGPAVGVVAVASLFAAPISLPTPAFAQPTFTITAQDRSVTASVSCISAPGASQTLSPPDFNSSTATARAQCNHAIPPGGFNSAACMQVSTIGPDSISGSLSNGFFQDFGGSVSGGGICSLTFSTTAALRYDFTLTASGSLGPAWTVSLTNAFSAAGSASGGRSAAAIGIIDPGTYTFDLHFTGVYPSAGLTYSLNLTGARRAA